MPSVSRVTDLWVGICCCHVDPPCIGMGGFIVTSSLTHNSSGLGVARLGDVTIGYCGHPGIIVSGSSTNLTNGLGKALVGSSVAGCNIGVVVTGDPTHISI